MLCTQTTRVGRLAQMADQRRRDQRALPRLLGGAVDELERRPAGALVGDRRPPHPVAGPVRARRPSGTARPARTARRARAARSTATSRACHVGVRSSCSASSCSSSTTIAARSGHGAHAAARAPIDDVDAARGRASHSLGHAAPPTARRGAGGRRAPAPRRPTGGRPASARARQRVPSTSGSGSVGRRHAAPPPLAERRPRGVDGRHRCGVDRRPGRPRTVAGGLAATRNGRRRPAPQRTDAQRARSMTSAGGPMPDHLGDRQQPVDRHVRRRRRRGGRPSRRRAGRAAGRAPCDPSRTRRRRARRGRGSRMLVEAGDVGDDAGDAQRAAGQRRGAVGHRRRPVTRRRRA